MKTEVPTIIEDRLKGLSLKTGMHRAPGTPENPACELCAMEAAAYIYGFNHSDRDEHACPVLGEVVRSWNDRVDFDLRQKLLPLLPRIALSRSTRAVEMKRGYLFADVAVRVVLANILEACEEKEWAEKFRALPKLNDETSCRRSRELVSSFADFLATPSTSPAPSSVLKQNLYALALDLALDLALALDLDRARALALALDLARALDRARALARALDPAQLNELIYIPTFGAIEAALDITE